MRGRISSYLVGWGEKGYDGNIPEEAPLKLEAANKAPSYRAICRAILKNDTNLATLGFTVKKCEAYSILKRIEIEARGRK